MSATNLGRIAFVYRSHFKPGREYVRYDIVEAHGNLYHCTALSKSVYKEILVDENGETVFPSNQYWNLFLKGTGGFRLIDGDGISCVRDENDNWTVSSKVKVIGDGKNVQVASKHDSATNEMIYTVSLITGAAPITSNTLKVKPDPSSPNTTSINWEVGVTDGIQIEQNKATGKWDFTATNSKVNLATWERWWVKYPWDAHAVPPTPPTLTYTGPIHYTSNGLSLIGIDPKSGNWCPCVSDVGGMVAGWQSGNPPVINWDLKYYITNKDDGVSELLPGVFCNTQTSSTSETERIQLYKYPDVTIGNGREHYACFGIMEEGTQYTKGWNGSGSGCGGTFANFQNGDIIAILTFKPNPEFASQKIGWDFHTQGGAHGLMIDYLNNKIYTATTSGTTSCKFYTDIECTVAVSELPFEDGEYFIMKFGNNSVYAIRKATDVEVEQYIGSNDSVQSECLIKEDKIEFNINVPSGSVVRSCSLADAEANYIVLDNEKMVYTCDIRTDIDESLTYTFTEDCILDIDENIKSKHIYKTGQKISLPYYSGCTFIPYTQTT